MPIINLKIGQSLYDIDCAEGEEEKITELAKKINQRVNNLSMTIRSANEKTILMFCALMVEEELQTVRESKILHNKSIEEDQEAIEDLSIEQIKDITLKIKNLTNKIAV